MGSRRSHEPGQLLSQRQVSDPLVNFTSAYGLRSVTVHMSLSLPRGTSVGNLPCRGNFSPCEKNAKVAAGQE